jgi:hypothetical protein
MNENQGNDKFIGSLISLPAMMNLVRGNKVKSVIQNYESEEHKKDDLNKKINEIDIEEEKVDNSHNISSLTLESLINEQNDLPNLTLEEISKIPIVDLPGRPQPIPTRPIFFDILYLSFYTATTVFTIPTWRRK